MFRRWVCNRYARIDENQVRKIADSEMLVFPTLMPVFNIGSLVELRDPTADNE